MKRTTIILLTLLLLPGFYTLNGQKITDLQSIEGSWLGKLSVGAVSLRIIFNFNNEGKDSLTATLDSPDQGAKNIKIGPVKIDGDSIKISALILLGKYAGTIKNDTLIEGIWTQRGNSLPLNLTKLKNSFSLNRPQEPKPPFPYLSQEVTFENKKAGITLAGTLTIPKGNGPFPAVILITGSGAQNRNEELMGHKPFWVIADYLSRNGIAVLRYDDRGVGKSKGSFIGSTSADFATDAEAAFNYLKTNPYIDEKSIGLAGHSEGGLIAAMVAATNHSIRFIVSIAGTGVTGEKILYKQNYDLGKASGMKKNELKRAISTSRKMYAVIKKETNNKKAEEKLAAILKKSLIREKASPEVIKKTMDQFPVTTATLTDQWYRYFITTNPADNWKRVTCPVLALNGDKDLQVSADVNLPAIKKALKSGGNDLVKTIKLPGLNHLFQHCTTGLPAEYGDIEETFSPEALKIISDWIHNI